MTVHELFLFVARLARRCEHYLAVAYAGAEVTESHVIFWISCGLFATGVLALAYEAIQHAD